MNDERDRKELSAGMEIRSESDQSSRSAFFWWIFLLYAIDS